MKAIQRLRRMRAVLAEDGGPRGPRLERAERTPYARADVVIRRAGDGSVMASVPRSVIHHSPTGWEYGYAGSGPADLALAIMAAFLPPTGPDDVVKCWAGSCSERAWALHQQFKFEFLAGLDQRKCEHRIGSAEIRRWIYVRGGES